MKLAATFALAILLTGCASAQTPAPATGGTRPAAESAPAAGPSGCAAALAILPSSPPAAEQAAADDVTLLGGRKGTTLDNLLDAVAADSFEIGLDEKTGSGQVAAAVSRWSADAEAVRSFCR